MADQLSLPNIAHPDICGFLRTRTRRKFLGDDRLEQFGIVEPIARLILGYGLLEQLLVAVAVQHTVATRRAGRPACEFRLGDDMDIEQHGGKAVAAEMR